MCAQGQSAKKNCLLSSFDRHYFIDGGMLISSIPPLQLLYTMLFRQMGFAGTSILS